MTHEELHEIRALLFGLLPAARLGAERMAENASLELTGAPYVGHRAADEAGVAWLSIEQAEDFLKNVKC